MKNIGNSWSKGMVDVSLNDSIPEFRPLYTRRLRPSLGRLVFLLLMHTRLRMVLTRVSCSKDGGAKSAKLRT